VKKTVHEKQPMTSQKKGMLLIIAGLLLITMVIMLVVTQRSQEEPTEESQTSQRIITYNGEAYAYNNNLVNILFLGIDHTDPVQTQEISGEAGQADSIIIISINKTDETATLYQVNRNSMTEIDVYDTSGNKQSSYEGQICLQFAYGDGEETSCWATKKTVQELLYDLPIDGYFAMNISSISTINDAVGGVTLTVPEDYTNLNAAFVKGTTLTLTGEQAESYVRSRDHAVTGSNQQRMQRQIQYLTALMNQVKASDQEALYETIMPLVSPYMTTDLSADQLKQMMDYTYLMEDTGSVPGETTYNAETAYDEFHVDEQALYQDLLQRFYEKQ